jgi:hypothetical protein
MAYSCERLVQRPRVRKLIVGLLMSTFIAGTPSLTSDLLAQQTNISVAVHPEAPGVTVPPDFIGLSFETADILPGKDGSYPYFRSDNEALIRLFKTLGVKSLRIGGGSADEADTKIPTRADIGELFGFVNAAHLKVIYTLRILNSSPGAATATAKYLMTHYRPDIECIAIGNEPNVLKPYDGRYTAYRDDVKKYMEALIAAEPNMKFCGPNGSPGSGPAWAAGFAKDFGPSGHVKWVTQHSYPGGNGTKVTDPAAARQQMLSPSFADRYEKLYQSFVPEVEAAGLSYRIEETNSFWGGGAKDVSNTFASALWGLDYMYWWASRRAQGLNFHTGERFLSEDEGPGKQPELRRFWYAVFWTSNGYSVHPLGYALKSFDLGSKGTIIPATISPNNQGVRVYSVLAANKVIYITLINMTEDGGRTRIQIQAPAGYGKAESLTLSVPGGNLAATSGVTLGGASITADGRWSGKWEELKSKPQTGQIPLSLQPASAVVIRLAPGS